MKRFFLFFLVFLFAFPIGKERAPKIPKKEICGELNDSSKKEVRRVNNSLQIKKRVLSSRKNVWLWVIATAYTLADGDGDGLTATGTRPKEGRTVAVDPRVIPYGSKIFIPGYGWRVAEDTGGKIKGNRIDIYFESRKRALQFGVKRMKILVCP